MPRLTFSFLSSSATSHSAIVVKSSANSLPVVDTATPKYSSGQFSS